MTSRAQFEAMLEALVEGDQEAAKDIFHNIVVGKSREIYEQLLAEDFNFDEASEEEEEGEAGEGDEAEDGADHSETAEFGDDDAEDGDADLDFDADEHDGEDSDEPLEDRVVDLEDALEDLKAEFERLMADEKNEPEHDDIFGHEGESEEEGDAGESDFNFGQGAGGEDEHKMFEYVNKVALPKHGDDGVNVKSPVAGKNDMGGTAANIARGGEAKAGGTKGGLLDPSTKDLSGGNVNVPGSNRAAKLHSVSKGHGAEKKGAGENADNKRSIFGGKR